MSPSNPVQPTATPAANPPQNPATQPATQPAATAPAQPPAAPAPTAPAAAPAAAVPITPAAAVAPAQPTAGRMELAGNLIRGYSIMSPKSPGTLILEGNVLSFIDSTNNTTVFSATPSPSTKITITQLGMTLKINGTRIGMLEVAGGQAANVMSAFGLVGLFAASKATSGANLTGWRDQLRSVGFNIGDMGPGGIMKKVFIISGIIIGLIILFVIFASFAATA